MGKLLSSASLAGLSKLQPLSVLIINLSFKLLLHLYCSNTVWCYTAEKYLNLVKISIMRLQLLGFSCPKPVK